MTKLAFILILILSSSLNSSLAIAQQSPIQTLIAATENSAPVRNQIVYETQQVESLGPEIWDRLKINFTNGKATITYSYSPESLKKPELLLRDISFLSWYRVSTRVPDSVPLLTEQLFNALHGSNSARWVLMLPLSQAFDSGQGDIVIKDHIEKLFKTIPEFTKYFVDDTKNAELAKSISLEFENESKKYSVLQNRDLKAKAKAWETWKKQSGALDALDKAHQKLDDYIKNNDRKNTRRLIEAYLPWPLMDAFETQMWKAWLQALETKPSANDSMIAFRGLSYDTDFRFHAADGRPGFMSTLLTKNQGNYNRRLRSLTTQREANGRTSFKVGTNTPNPSYLAIQMAVHADDPKGSAFLSFTPAIDVATAFMGAYNTSKNRAEGAFMAVRLSKSRIFTNGAAGYEYVSERELLVPLVIFPEDVIYYKERDPGQVPSSEAILKDLQKVLTTSEYSKVVAGQKSYPNKVQMISDYFKFIEDYKKSPPMCISIFMSP